MRLGIAEQLLLSAFEPDEPQLRAEAEELQHVLQQHLWPALGISQQGHRVLYAWIHFCHFAEGGSAVLLAVAKSTLLGLRNGGTTGQGVANSRSWCVFLLL